MSQVADRMPYRLKFQTPSTLLHHIVYPNSPVGHLRLFCLIMKHEQKRNKPFFQQLITSREKQQIYNYTTNNNNTDNTVAKTKYMYPCFVEKFLMSTSSKRPLSKSVCLALLANPSIWLRVKKRYPKNIKKPYCLKEK